MNAKTHTRPLVIATAVLLTGIAASVAGNLQAINLDNAAPGVGAHISAIFWPVLLFLLIEVMLHTPWIVSWRDGLTKWAGLGLAAAVALYVSYGHLVTTLDAYGYDWVSAHAGPVAVDGAMVMAALAINRIGQARRGQDATRRGGMVLSYAKPIGPMLAPALTPVPAIADEARTWLDSLEDAVLDSQTTVAYPVSPAPMTNAVKPESIPAEAATLIYGWLSADPTERPTAGATAEFLAAQFEVSPRTIRRWTSTLKGANA
jgi:hypothetical protein